MNFSYPFPCLAIFMLFIVIYTINRKKSDQKQKELQESFLERESKANATRRQDISNLPYVKISDALLDTSDNFLNSECADELADLKVLSEKKLLNLTTYSNTDLKLMYGPQNLDALSSFDSNFTDMEIAITSLSKKCIESGHDSSCLPYLEFAVYHKTTDSQIYVMLANIYNNLGQRDKIEQLVAGLNTQDFLMKKPILDKLQAMIG